MKYIIYGINRTAKDFMYIFNELDILYLTDDDVEPGRIVWEKYSVRRLEDALKDTSYDRIIICDFDKAEKEGRLRAEGLAYGKDYVYAEDFFDSLDAFSIPQDRKIAVWGTGNMCRFLMGKNLPWKADVFIDSYKKTDFFMGCPVLRPDEIYDWKRFYVIIAVASDIEVRNELNGQGLREREDFIGYEDFLKLPSMLLRQTMFDKSRYDLKCSTMHNHLEILADGATRSCCTTFVAQGLDNIFDKNADKLWQSKLHKILCLSTENKTFSFCDKSMCPLFVAKKREEMSVPDEMPYVEAAPFPETLALGYDSSCNLFCGTCRKERHFAEGRELETVNRITDKVMENYLSNCRFLILAGNGEVFASPAYQRIYESEKCNPQFIRILSNGILFTPANWERFSKGKQAKIMLTVSVDAATKETYGRIRRGGNFEALKRNMEFASKLRRNGDLCYFRMNFVVQRENYKEMVPFVEWGQELGVDEIFFTKILNWGTYTPEEFLEVSMMEQDGITPKPELKEVLSHPVMQSSIVDMGTIQFGHKIDEIDVVENYYMWELEKRGGKIFS